VLFTIAGLPLGGAEQQLLELVRGLNKSKFRIIVLTLSRGGALEPEFKKVPGVRLIGLKRKGISGFCVLLKIVTILRRMKVDVVQAFITPAIFYSIFPALICRTPVKIVTERSGPGRKNDTPLRYRTYLLAEDFLTRFTDWSVANSEAGKRYLIERGINPLRVKVIYNGVNLHRLNAADEKVCEIRQKMGVPPAGKIVGMIATLFPVKNHTTFLNAAARICNLMPDVRFALVGSGPLRSPLESLANDLGLESKVMFFGDQRDVGAYLKAFDIAVLTSDTEGCSNFLLEAMALGKAVLATDVGGNREVVCHRGSGILVAPRDAQALSDAVVYLLSNPALVQSMGQMGREIAITKFSLEKMVSEYESLYEYSLQRICKHADSTLHGARVRGTQNHRVR